MINHHDSEIVACLDLGSTRLICSIAEIKNNEIRIIGFGHKKSQGILSSAISDMKLAQQSIAKVVGDAEKSAGININKILIAISPAQTISNHRNATIKISSDIVRDEDIKNLAQLVRAQYKKK